MNSPTFIRLRFAFKLSFAIVFALFVGFHLNLETPRWSAMTAAIVAAGPAAGEAGAIRHRGWLRIIGTFIGCFVGLIIIITTARAPVVMLLLCCIWAGFCTWLSSLIKVENSYAWGLAGYTALIIIVTVATSEAHLLEAPQFAIERCSEIVLGIVSAVLADLLFSPRSIKQDIDRAVDQLLVDQYRLMQMCISNADKEDIDRAWSNLVKSTTALDGMRNNLMMSPRAGEGQPPGEGAAYPVAADAHLWLNDPDALQQPAGAADGAGGKPAGDPQAHEAVAPGADHASLRGNAADPHRLARGAALPAAGEGRTHQRQHQRGGRGRVEQ